MSEVINKLPVIAIKGMTILPYMVIHFDISKKPSIKAIEYAMLHGQKMLITSHMAGEEKENELDSFEQAGTVSEIRQIMKLPDGSLRVLFKGLFRAEIIEYFLEEDLLFSKTEVFSEKANDFDEFTEAAYVRTLKDAMGEYAAGNPKINKESFARLMSIDELDELIYRVVAELPMEANRKFEILKIEELIDRLDFAIKSVKREINIAKIRNEFVQNVRMDIDKHQKEYVLREQLHKIREELGEEGATETEEFLYRIDALNADEQVKEKLRKEVKRYSNMSSSASEANVIRTYVETLLEMPWNNSSEDNNDIVNAKNVLNEDHYGLEKVKERILEFLAVRILKGKQDAPVICLVGPPGTGKTSIAASVAKALNKKYVRICLGGVRDEAEIRGHRRTYVGAMPGRIIEGIKSAGTKNPLMLLDEIDKTGTDSRGDTASALLEVLDSAQNSKFMDHYMEVPVDLSEVMFIATANDASAIPKPLYDRMEIIELSSYTENEKLHIAKEHLLSKQLEKNGLKKKELSISDTALEEIIHGYTREAGVRTLERKIATICRVTAKKILSGELDNSKQIRVSAKNLVDFLGKPKYKETKADDEAAVGMVTGLAWTSVGGDTLSVEVNTMPGKGEMILTGNLGDVMKESARIALSYVRSVSKEYSISDDFFEKHDLHIHIPEGAVPKDGPSAGITMSIAILSAVTNIPIRAKLAMTGEVTLRGKVLPIGGLKEKLLAANKYSIKTVLVPEQNRADVEELDEEITKGLEIIFVKNMAEVAKYAFVK